MLTSKAVTMVRESVSTAGSLRTEAERPHLDALEVDLDVHPVRLVKTAFRVAQSCDPELRPRLLLPRMRPSSKRAFLTIRERRTSCTAWNIEPVYDVSVKYVFLKGLLTLQLANAWNLVKNYQQFLVNIDSEEQQPELVSEINTKIFELALEEFPGEGCGRSLSRLLDTLSCQSLFQDFQSLWIFVYYHLTSYLSDPEVMNGELDTEISSMFFMMAYRWFFNVLSFNVPSSPLLILALRHIEADSHCAELDIERRSAGSLQMPVREFAIKRILSCQSNNGFGTVHGALTFIRFATSASHWIRPMSYNLVDRQQCAGSSTGIRLSAFFADKRDTCLNPGTHATTQGERSDRRPLPRSRAEAA